MRKHRHLAHLPSFRDNPIVFFTTCALRRQKLLACPECHEVLRDLWERSSVHDGWWVGHYILMPDHVHFFARPEVEARPMASWVQMWKGVSSRKIAAALKISPPIWQPEYFDRYLRSSENYSDKWDYVLQNAVRAGLVETAEAWPYRGIIHDLMFGWSWRALAPDPCAGEILAASSEPAARGAHTRQRPEGGPAPTHSRRRGYV